MLQVFCYTLKEELYPFYQLKRESVEEAEGRKIYENKVFILEFFKALIFLPILFIAILCWNIARALPFWCKKEALFPEKIIDLASGINRSDYLTGGANPYVLHQKLHRLIHQRGTARPSKDLNTIFHGVTAQDVDSIYHAYELHIKHVLQGFISQKTRVPVSTLLSRVHMVLKFFNKGEYLSVGDHVWLYFFRHIYRSYFPWEQSGFIPPGQVNKVFIHDARAHVFFRKMVP